MTDDEYKQYLLFVICYNNTSKKKRKTLKPSLRRGLTAAAVVADLEDEQSTNPSGVLVAQSPAQATLSSRTRVGALPLELRSCT